MKVYYNRNTANTITVINYSNELYTQSQKLNTRTALKTGKVKKVISYSSNDIDENFYLQNKTILEEKRGGGYWLWKPYIIKKALSEINDGEYLFYCDSGSLFVNDVGNLLNSFDLLHDIMPFEMQLIEKDWTKRDCFKLLECDDLSFVNSKQIQATYSLWRKSAFSCKFVNEWLTFAQDPRVLTDLENQMGLPNYSGFIDHRHDQSIFSLLIKKYSIKAYRDPSQYGSKYIQLYPESKYPQILTSTRQINISFFERFKRLVRPYLIFKISFIIYKKIRDFSIVYLAIKKI